MHNNCIHGFPDEASKTDEHAQYCNITLDVGAAMNVYLVKWLKSEEFKNVKIHLGDFHLKLDFAQSFTIHVIII